MLPLLLYPMAIDRGLMGLELVVPIPMPMPAVTALTRSEDPEGTAIRDRGIVEAMMDYLFNSSRSFRLRMMQMNVITQL